MRVYCAPAVKMMNSIKNYKIYNGDCVEIMKKLPEASANLIFADPPYWMRVSGSLERVEGTEYDGCNDSWDNSFSSLADYAHFTRTWLAEARRLLHKNGSLWVIGSMQCVYTIGNALQELGFWLINDVIWWKNNPTPNMKGNRLCNAHETLIWAVKDEKAKFTFHYKTGKELNRDTVSEADYLKGIRKQLGSVWRFPVCSGSERLRDENGKKLHSTQKPYALLHRIINLCSSRGDLVLDPFGGTFTSGAAALESGRNFIGIDSNPEYCAHGEKRLAECRDKNGPIENALYDEKPLKISLKEMIASGFLQNGEFLFAKSGEKALLQEDGKIKLSNGLITDIHTGAAISSNGKSARLNGFNYWYAQRGNEFVGIDEIREKARKNDSGNDYKNAKNKIDGGI